MSSRTGLTKWVLLATLWRVAGWEAGIVQMMAVGRSSELWIATSLSSQIHSTGTHLLHLPNASVIIRTTSPGTNHACHQVRVNDGVQMEEGKGCVLMNGWM